MATSTSEAVTFVHDLYGASPPRGKFVALWSKADKRTHYLVRADDADRFVGQPDIYVHAALAGRSRGQHARILNVDAGGIPGVWADIDLPGPEDTPGKRRAPDIDTALDLANSIVTPTIVVGSGYGVQAWWLFEDLWTFNSDNDRDRGAQITRGWQILLRQGAQQRGFDIDSTHDLARLMRLPGTINTKGGGEAKVSLIEADGPRYTIDEIAGPALVAAPREASKTRVQLSLDDSEAKVSMFRKRDALIENSDIFRKTWEHSRRDRAVANWSMSEWDLSLASQAMHAGWDDAEIAALIAEHRRTQLGDADEKSAHMKDYLERTVTKAKADIQRDQRAEMTDQSLEELAQMSESPNGHIDADRAISLFNNVLSGGVDGAPVVKEIVQYNDDPDEARYVLVLVDGREINIGGYANLRQPRRLDERLGPSTRFVMETVKDNDRWRSALRSLLRVAQVREEGDERALDWVRRYTEDRLGAKRDVAARASDPFEENGTVFVYAAGLAGYVRAVLRERINNADVIPLLRKGGFELQRVHYETKAGKQSTKSYWAIKREELE